MTGQFEFIKTDERDRFEYLLRQKRINESVAPQLKSTISLMDHQSRVIPSYDTQQLTKLSIEYGSVLETGNLSILHNEDLKPSKMYSWDKQNNLWNLLYDKTISTSEQIDDSVSNSHRHLNINVLAELKDIDGDLYFKGKPIGSSSGGFSYEASKIIQSSLYRMVSDSDIARWNSKQDLIGFTPIDSLLIGAPSGISPLDSNGKIPLSFLPDLSSNKNYVVIDMAARDNITDHKIGDRCIVLDAGDGSREGFIWDGTLWLKDSDTDWANINLDWSNINNKPTSAASAIDDAVTKKHAHNNSIVINNLSDDGSGLKYNGALISNIQINDSEAKEDKVYSSLKTQQLYNELFTSVSNGKDAVATAIADKGVQANGSDTFNDLAVKISQISSGKNIANKTKLNVVAPHTTNIPLSNAITLDNICTSVIEYIPGEQNVVQYNCNFDNSDSSNFVENTNVGYTGVMSIKPQINSFDLSDHKQLSGGKTFETTYINKSSLHSIDNIDLDNQSVTVTGSRPPQTIYAIGDIDISGIENISQIIWNTNESSNGKLLLIASFDGGNVWLAWDPINKLWQVVNANSQSDIRIKGMTKQTINSLTSEQIELARENKKKVRFAYYIERPRITDTSENDSITIKVNMYGSNSIATNSKYNYSLSPDGSTITYNFTTSGTYTITWVD